MRGAEEVFVKVSVRERGLQLKRWSFVVPAHGRNCRDLIVRSFWTNGDREHSGATKSTGEIAPAWSRVLVRSKVNLTGVVVENQGIAD